MIDPDTDLDPVTEDQVEQARNDSVPSPFADIPPELNPTLRADVMYAAVVCAEEVPYPQVTASPDLSSNFQQTTRDALNQLVKLKIYTDEFCSQLGIPPADPIQTQAVQSNLPALVIAGDTDSSSPPAWSKLTAETLTHSQYVEFPRAGHSVVTRGFDCSAELLFSYLDAPEEPVDRTCVDALPLVDYHIWTKSDTNTETNAADKIVPD